MGVLKLTYLNDPSGSDFRLENIDRSSLYIDPNAKHDISNASWVIEKFGLTKREVLRRINDGFWKLPPGKTQEDILRMTQYVPGQEVNRSNYAPMHTYEDLTFVAEDELVEVWEYWSSPKNGLSDAYAVMIGGSSYDTSGFLVRYGSNPFPYKNHPYFGKSYDTHEFNVDGEGLVEEMEGIQKMLNTFINLRIDDIRQNVNQQIAVIGNYFDDTTLYDMSTNQKFVRMSEQAHKDYKMDPSGFNLGKVMQNLPVNTSTGELYNDISFLLSQLKETTGVTDVFSGSSLPGDVTRGQYEQTLNRSVGIMRPVLLKIGALIEEVSDAILVYLKDPAFFGDERIIRIIGQNKYKKAVSGWHSLPDGSNVRSVSPDDLMVDGTMTSINGFEDQIKSQIVFSNIVQVLQALSLNPDMYNDIRQDINFSNITKEVFRSSRSIDLDSAFYSEEEKQARKQQMQQMQQQQLAIQQQMQQQQMQQEIQKEAAIAESKEQSKAEAEIAVDQAKNFAGANKQLLTERQRILFNKEAEIEKNADKIERQLQADLDRMDAEFGYEQRSDSQIGHGNNINK